ncbi:hypothetical protein [Candidatus Blastococcus massiliensis]|uniref:hypothetical protein n=1 Tax=Candidatus Blastococcus massiliensis TaxID=1470358 RepID=UPI0012DE37AE|nr:hypothetical protein [Candidatus Blastococcus massiliensis]
MSAMGGLPGSEMVLGTGVEGWWLVGSEEDSAGHVVAGPFPDRAEAGWSAAALADGEAVRPVYGSRRPDGSLRRRPSPQEWAWLAHLTEQLDRVPDEWSPLLSEEDPLTTLLVEVTAAISEAGLPLHDATGGDGALGGACLTPTPDLDGVVVAWRQHDRMSVDQVHGAAADAAVQQAMNRALSEVLAARGFEPAAWGAAVVVRQGG